VSTKIKDSYTYKGVIKAIDYAKSLNEKEKTVLKERLNGLTLREIANNFKVTPERIRQIEAKAVRRFTKTIRLASYKDKH